MTRGRDQNHVHTTPELDTGDAGPHTSRRVPQAPLRQVTLPDYDAAVQQLVRAVATSGRERAAHTRLEPHIHTAREHAWQRDWDREHPTLGLPAGAEHPDHRRRERSLQAALTAEQRAHAGAASWSQRVQDLTTALDQAPFYARARRRDLSGQLTAGRQQLHHAVTVWETANGHVRQLTDLVGADRAQRDRDTAAARQQAHHAWAARGNTPHVDANTLTYPIGTWTGRDPRPPQIDDVLWRTPTTPTRDQPSHVLER